MSHYQPVLPLKNTIDSFYTIVDLISVIKDEYDQDYQLEQDKVYLTTCNDGAENDNESMAIVIFSKNPRLFPLTTHLKYGASVSLEGKTYHLSYNEEDMLTIGFENVLYLLENKDFISDCISVYETIWEFKGQNLISFKDKQDKDFVN